MKISCQSCQAKYTIADEKVLGKIVKIRCKKCGATIVINGNESGAGAGTSQAEAQAFDYAGAGAADQWTVNVADGDQRTMSFDEVVAGLKAGTISDETYCWKDGMADWLPIREIAELQSAASGDAAPPPAAMSPDSTYQDQAASPPAHEEPPTLGGYSGYGGGAAPAPAAAVSVATSNGNGNGAALFGGTPEPAPAAARRQGARAGGGMDLFGSVSQAGAEDDVMTSAAAGMPQASDEPGKLTGQRNENSVLFSLNALTQNAPKSDAPPPAGEGSGLIDIRALSASMADKDAGKRNHADDIMNLGGGGAFSAALAAPVLAPPAMGEGAGMMDMGGAPQKDNTKLILGGILGAGALIALAIVLVFALKKPETPAIATPTAMPTDTATGAGTAAPGAATVAQNDTAPTDTAAAAAAAAGGAAAPGTGQAASPSAPKGGGGGGSTHHAGGGGGGGGAVAAAPATPTPAPAAPQKAASLDDALRAAGGGGGGGGAPAAAAQSSAPFDRGAAAAALGSVNVASCKKADGPTGAGHVKVTFSPSGTVQSAVVDQPPFAGTAVGGCVAGKFRGAHIPAFSGSPVPVGKSFVIE